MKYFKTFERLKIVDESVEKLSELFFTILKKDPLIYKNRDKSSKHGQIDWFKHGLKMRDLKKLPTREPSLSQALAAEKLCFKKFKKWLKENPVMKSDILSQDKTGTFD